MLSVRSFRRAEYQTYAGWFADAELSRRLSLIPQWFEYVTQTPGVFAWMIVDGQIPVAVVQFGAEPIPSLALAIKPGLRGRGLCKPVLRLVLALPEIRRFEAVFGFVEPDNVASLRCAGGLGAIDHTPDADGLLRVRFSPTAAAEAPSI